MYSIDLELYKTRCKTSLSTTDITKFGDFNILLYSLIQFHVQLVMLNKLFHQLLVETKMIFSSTQHPRGLLNQQNMFSFLKTVELYLDRKKYLSSGILAAKILCNHCHLIQTTKP